VILARAVGCGLLILLLAGVARAAPPAAVVLGEEARVLLDGALPAPEATPTELVLCRGEVGALQVAVRGPERGVTVELAGLGDVVVERYVEHAVAITTRSHGRARDADTLGWQPAARPDDAGILGLMPDALIPLAQAPAWRPYPLVIEAGQLGVVWIDLSATTVGVRRGEIQVARGAEVLRLPLLVDVRDCQLPARVVHVLAYFDPATVVSRTGSEAAIAATWRMLGAHGVDPLADLTGPADATRLGPGLAGEWFDDHHHPYAAALGAYGALGDPDLEKARLAVALGRAIPADVLAFIYAVDEVCPSPRPRAWRTALSAIGAPAARPLIGQTCARAPAYQPVDLVIIPSQTWRRQDSDLAHSVGHQVWVYNGQLPRSTTLLLDAPPGAAVALGWIAATRQPGSAWFLWEAAFWDDSNEGGHGPVDPFATAETFHNQHGDLALGDGLLVYPGTQVGAFAAHSLGIAGVVPSMRLKRLRRGLEDAGLLALAAYADPIAARRIADRAMPRTLDEISRNAPRTAWLGDGSGFATARAELRALIPAGTHLDASDARTALHSLQAVHPRPAAIGGPVTGVRRLLQVLLASAIGMIAAAAIAVGLRRFAGPRRR
jgi:hypothetical protein